MPCSKVLTSARLILFNLHIRIAKTYNLFYTISTCFNYKLLATRDLSPRLVTWHLFLVKFWCFLTHYAALFFFFFQLILFELVFFLAADVHCALVGLQAGYGLFEFFADFLPQGLPVLQSIQPLPLFLLNHLCKLSPAIMLFSFSSSYCYPSWLRQPFYILLKHQTHTLRARRNNFF
jgi:hypothetical protein